MASRRVFSLALILGLCALAGMAQDTRATISGTVTDVSGAVVVGATLNLKGVGTGVSFTTETSAAGQYRFLFLNPGAYKLAASATGFKSYERDKIELHVAQAAGIDISLQVGAMTESVTVSGEAALLEVEKVDRGMVIETTRIEDLPMSKRNPIMLANLSAGMMNSGSPQHVNPFSNSSISSWSVNGGQVNNVEFLMDGAPNNAYSGQTNRIAYVPPSDAVGEFKVITGIYDAQYGRTAGGVINVAVKSGTNAVHGSAYEFTQHTPWNANTFANNSKNLPREGNALNQYGFTVGGPVRLPKLYNGTDKTFFFFAAEDYGEDLQYPLESITSVPTVEQRRGDFSKTTDTAGRLMPIYDPMTGRFDSSNRWVRSPFAGNVIPQERINPTSQKILSLYPNPNTLTSGSTAWQNNFVLAPNPGYMDFQNFTARIDHMFGARQRVYGRWSWNRHESFRIKNAIPGLGADHQTAGKTNNGIVLDWVSVINSATTFNLRTSLTRWQEFLPGFAHKFSATDWGWPKSLVDQLPIRGSHGARKYPTRILFYFRTAQLPGATRVPFIAPSGYGSLGSNSYIFEPTNVLSLQPNFALIRGRHSIKTGLDFRVSRFTDLRPDYAGGRLEFDRGFTRADYLTQDALSGNSMASLLLGNPSGGRIDNKVDPYWQTFYYAPWVQDDVKLTRKLTINLGLRWDFNLPPTERYNRVNRDFLATTVNPISGRIDQTKFPGYKVSGGIGFAGVNGLPRAPLNGDYNNIQPRFGAAFQINSKTVMRGGWGIFYMSPLCRGASNGFSQSTPYVSTLDSGRTPANTVSNPFPSGVLKPVGASMGMETFLGQSPGFSNPNGRVPYVHQFSLGFQRQLPGNIMIDASYVGSRTKAAIVSKPVNELSLDALALGDSTKGGNPNYLNTQVPNPFANLIPGTALDNATVARQQLLRPYPQFSSFMMMDRNDGEIWYNALQVTFDKRYSRGLTLLATYTLSKNVEALSYLNGQDAAPTRTLVDWDRPHRLVLAPMYELPFGPGRKLLNQPNGLVSRLVGGWQAVITGTLQSGDPMSVPGNVYLLGDPRLPNPAWDRLFKTGVIDANGAVRNVLAGEQPVFQIRPPFTVRTTPLRYGNLRNQSANTYDFALTKTTRIREGMKMVIRLELFNMFNTPVFSSDPNLDPTSPSFAKIFRDAGQANRPRVIQLGFRFNF
jgi:hypothetical protein